MNERAERLLSENQQSIQMLCARYGVTRMRPFGSAAHGHAAEFKDLDFLVEYGPKRLTLDPLDALVGLQVELENLFGVCDDVVDWDAAVNTRFRTEAATQAVTVYAA